VGPKGPKRVFYPSPSLTPSPEPEAREEKRSILMKDDETIYREIKAVVKSLKK
jgi:hypothetical protein